MSHDEHPEHLHLLEAGWDDFHFIYELEPADEMPASYMSQHLVIIALENGFISVALPIDDGIEYSVKL